MSNLNRYTEIHNQVENYYQSAMRAYATQRKGFIDALKTNTIKDEKDFIDQLNTQIGQEVMNEDLQQKFDESFKIIEDAVIKIFNESGGKEYFGSENEGLLKQKKESGRLQEDTLEHYYNRMINDIENFLSTNQMTRAYISKIVSSNQLAPSSATEKVILNQFYGYARRVMFATALGQKTSVSTARYKSSLKGYYKEDLITNGLNSLLKNMGLAAYGTGAIPDKDGRQIEMDIFIGKKMRNSKNGTILDKLENKMNILTGISAEASIKMGEPTNIGMQSKSWIEPWADGNGGNRTFLSIGHRSQLLNAAYPKGLYSWHEGIRFAAQNMQKILGVNNVLFSTGTGVKWTVDLINEMKNNNYYLAFYISKKSKKATGEVVWETDPAGHK